MRGRGGQRGRGSTQGGHGTREWGTKLSTTQNGPLMTDHLRDIDIELEILNRRRQMLQQEHELLDRERQFNLKRQYHYEQPLTSYNQPNYYHKQGNKRQAVERAPSKQFNPPARVEPWEHSAQSINPSYVAKPPPLLSLPRNPPSRPVPPRHAEFRHTKPTPPLRNNFNPIKVTKRKTRTAYLKKTVLSDTKDIKPITNTPTPTNVPPKSSVASTAAAMKNDEFILRHNVQPSPQLNGRLELALGAILKGIKKNYPSNFYEIAKSSQSQRLLKQLIRERIRSVMLDKKVGHVQEVVASYRDKYPVETDAELLKIGHDCKVYNIHTLGIMPTINSEHIKEFFKANLKNVLHKKLEKLLSHLQDSGTLHDGDERINKMMNDVVDLQDGDVIEDQTETSDTQNDDNSKKELSEEEIIKRNINKAKIYTKLMENLIDVKLPYILTQHRETLVSLIDADMEYRHAKAQVVEATVKEAVSVIVKKLENPSVTDPAIVTDTVVEEAELTKENESASILETTLPQNTSISSQTDVKTPTTKITDHPYYVKLIGRPEIPSRASMYAYLEQFKPASIKKHKTIGNLLVVGFNDKEGYDKILEAGEKIIGTNTITVKSSEKVNSTPQKENPQSTENIDTAQQKIDKALNDTTSKEPKTSLGDASLPKSIEETSKGNDEDNKNEASDGMQLYNSFNISQDLEDQISNILTAVGEEYEESNKDNISNDSNTENQSSEKSVENEEKPLSEINIVEDTSEIKSEEHQSPSKENIQSKEVISNDNENFNGKDTKDEREEGKSCPETENNKTPEKEEISAQRVELKDVKRNLKDSGRATPTRSSSRLASTPSTIKTRRASRLAQN